MSRATRSNTFEILETQRRMTSTQAARLTKKLVGRQPMSAAILRICLCWCRTAFSTVVGREGGKVVRPMYWGSAPTMWHPLASQHTIQISLRTRRFCDHSRSYLLNIMIKPQKAWSWKKGSSPACGRISINSHQSSTTQSTQR